MMQTTIPTGHAPGRAPCASTADPAVLIPRDHVGPYFMSGLGRMIWWTGRVAIGLRYEPLRDRALHGGGGAEA